MTTTGSTTSSTSSRDSTSDLDVFSAEFAKLVSAYTPSRTDTPPAWLGRLPNEAFKYYRRGIATFGEEVNTPTERRGRLYLIHTTLVLMWMSWGKGTARERFQTYTEKGVRRTASIVTLECYRRGGILAEYETADWFFRPVDEWPVALKCAAFSRENVSRHVLKQDLSENAIVRADVETLSALRSSGAVPSLDELPIAN